LELNKTHIGDCMELSKDIPDNYVDLVVTSPPYDDLRSYKGRTVQRPEGLKYLGKPVLKPDSRSGLSYDDVRDYWKDLDKQAYYADNFRMEKAGGGMVGIRKPNAIAPTGGPQSQGLASTPEYGTYNKEYKWQT